MRRTKQINNTNRFLKQLGKGLEKIGIKKFHTDSYYFVFDCGRNNVVHFELPNNYRVGIWIHSKQIFAEHLYYIDKFKPSATEFSGRFECVHDILLFVSELSKVEDKEADAKLLKQRCDVSELNGYMYNFIRNIEGVHSFELGANSWRNTYKITLSSEGVDEEPIHDRIETELEKCKEKYGYSVLWESKYEYFGNYVKYYDI